MIAMKHGITVDELRGKMVRRNLQDARYELYETLSTQRFTLQAIGDYVGRTHGAVHQVLSGRRTKNRNP
jgi:hypothetical protein